MATTKFPGDLGTLPLELVWKILDELLTECSHSGFCAIHKLSHTNKDAAAHVDAYLARKTSIRLIHQALQADGCIPHEGALTKLKELGSDTPEINTFGPPLDFSQCELVPGLVTGIIKDDCLSCFNKVRKFMPELDGTYVNIGGWVFLAIAASSASLKMMKCFFSIESSDESRISLLELLTRDVNVFHNRVVNRTILRNIALVSDKEFSRDLFTFLIPRFGEISALAERGVFSQLDKLFLCRFITPEHAVAFEEVGMPLYDVSAVAPNGSNSYHAGAINGPEFLEYLHQKSSLSVTMRESYNVDSALPIHNAIRTNKLDSVIWLQAHGGADTHSFTDKPWTSGSAPDLAARMTTDESVEILKEVLRPIGLNEIGPFFCLGLLRSVTDGLRSHKYPGNLNKQDLANLKGRDEGRAVKKCKLILRFAKDSAEATGAKDGWEQAITRADELGFGNLADCIRVAKPKH